jgi:hypothetical protein
MDGAPQPQQDDAAALACELAGLGTVIDVARVRLGLGIGQTAPWMTPINKRDLLAAVNASAELEAALIRIVGSESLDLAARVQELGDLARGGSADELDETRDRNANARGVVLRLPSADRPRRPGRLRSHQ